MKAIYIIIIVALCLAHWMIKGIGITKEIKDLQEEIDKDPGENIPIEEKEPHGFN